MLCILAVPLLVFAIIYPTRGVATALSFIVGIGDSTAQSGIFPLAGGIHPRCTAAASLGIAIAGLAAGLLRILTRAVLPQNERMNSAVYFGMAVIILVLCCLAHYAIKQYKHEFILAFSTGEEGEVVMLVEHEDEKKVMSNYLLQEMQAPKKMERKTNKKLMVSRIMSQQ